MLALPHKLVDEPLGSSHAHEATDHEARAMRDHVDGLFDGNRLHGPISRPLLRGPTAIDGQCDAPDLRRRIGAQEDRSRSDLLGRCKFKGWLLVGK